MTQSFRDAGTEDIFNGVNSQASRSVCPQSLWKIAGRKLDQIDSAESINDLCIPPGNCLEVLKGDREGQYRIRINEQYRVCFSWEEAGPADVKIIDDH